MSAYQVVSGWLRFAAAAFVAATLLFLVWTAFLVAGLWGFVPGGVG